MIKTISHLKLISDFLKGIAEIMDEEIEELEKKLKEQK